MDNLAIKTYLESVKADNVIFIDGDSVSKHKEIHVLPKTFKHLKVLLEIMRATKQMSKEDVYAALRPASGSKTAWQRHKRMGLSIAIQYLRAMREREMKSGK